MSSTKDQLISKFLENMNLDIDFTGNELIIWGEFKES